MNEEKGIMMGLITSQGWNLYQEKVEALIKMLEANIFSHEIGVNPTQLQARIYARNILNLAKQIPFDIANDSAEEINKATERYIDYLSGEIDEEEE